LETFRVFGTKYQDYYTIVEAEDPYQAIDLANALPETAWNIVATDDVIEATDVYLNDDTLTDLQLNI
jgi:hypothetical protein